MRVVLLKPVTKESQRISVSFEVWGDDSTPIADGVRLGTDGLALPPHSSPQQIAEAIWERALVIAAEGLASWELHNQVAPLLSQMTDSQGG